MAKKSDEELIDIGKGALQRDYYKDIAYIAKDILEEAENDFDDYDDAEEFIRDRVDQDVDNASYIIYTGQHLDALMASENWLAIEERGYGGEFSEEQFTSMIQQAAYAAVHADVSEEIERTHDDYFKEGRKRNPAGAPKKVTKKVTKKSTKPKATKTTVSANRLKASLLR